MMNTDPANLIQGIARTYRRFLADFPSDLKPEQLEVQAGEQTSLFSGLAILRGVIGEIYDHFAGCTPTDSRWSDREYCYRAVEGPVKLLWAMGAGGQLIQAADDHELEVSREKLVEALGRGVVKDLAAACAALEAVGFHLTYRDADHLPCPGGLRKCSAVAVRYPAHNAPLLHAITYYFTRLPEKKAGRKEKGVILEVMLRADFRPLLPGYTYRMPHLPADEAEVTRTFEPETLDVWNEITRFMSRRHPQCRLYFRVPRIRNGGWVADYSVKEDDYGQYSIFVDEGGLYVRIVLIEGTINNMLEHVHELSPHFQETYLNAVACKDCSHCGKHVFYTHGNHVHRLCKSPWYFSPYLTSEYLPDIEHLIDFRLASLN